MQDFFMVIELYQMYSFLISFPYTLHSQNNILYIIYIRLSFFLKFVAKFSINSWDSFPERQGLLAQSVAGSIDGLTRLSV